MEKLIMLKTNFIPNVGTFRVIYTVKEVYIEADTYLEAEIFVLLERNNEMCVRGVIVRRKSQDLFINALVSSIEANNNIDCTLEFENADIYPVIHYYIEELLTKLGINNISQDEINLGILTNSNIIVLMDIKKRFHDVFSTIEKHTKSEILKQLIDLINRHTPPHINEIIF